jgi:intraflagellar transport protein 140
MCFELLEQPDVENALRVGDVYALMVEWFHSQGEMSQAFDLIQKMAARSIVLAPYLDQEMVSAICSAMGVDVPRDPKPAVPAAQVDGAEEVEDQIEEDFVDN